MAPGQPQPSSVQQLQSSLVSQQTVPPSSVAVGAPTSSYSQSIDLSTLLHKPTTQSSIGPGSQQQSLLQFTQQATDSLKAAVGIGQPGQPPHRWSRLLQLRLVCRRCSVVCPISLVWKLSIYIRSADQRTAQTVSAAECAAAQGTFGSASKSDVTTTTQCRPNGQAADHKDPQLRS